MCIWFNIYIYMYRYSQIWSPWPGSIVLFVLRAQEVAPWHRRVLFVDVIVVRAHYLGSISGPPDFWKLPYLALEALIPRLAAASDDPWPRMNPNAIGRSQVLSMP